MAKAKMLSSAGNGCPGKRILGVDPGLNITGYGVVQWTSQGPRIVEAGVIRGGARGSLKARLKNIHQGITEVIQSFGPQVVALEELYSHYARPRTAILMGHARGVICLAAAQADLDLHHYAATQIKKMLTGNGRAPKGQMQRAICQHFGLTSIPEPADVADALAIALCHGYLNQQAIRLL